MQWIWMVQIGFQSSQGLKGRQAISIPNYRFGKRTIRNEEHTVYYSLVEPITYLIFYYIAAGVIAVMSLIVLVYFLAARKNRIY